MLDKYVSKIKNRIEEFLKIEVTSSVAGEITVEGLIKREWNTIKLVYQTMIGRNVSIRASALTYTTLLSLIPMLAFIFSLLTALQADEKVKTYILKDIPGLGDIAGTILTYIENTNLTTLGSIGLVITFWAIFKALGSMERTINEIWGIRNMRPFLTRISYYTSIVVLAPLIILLSIGINTVLESNVIVQRLSEIFLLSTLLKIFIRILPYLITWLLFTFVYKVIPYTNVRIQAALFGGIIGGTLWQVILYLYTKLQFGLSRYNVIYSGFASIPFFMAWLYFSWLMLIVGAVAAYIQQNYSRFRESAGTESVSYSFRERLALRVFMAIATNFYEGKEKLSSDELADMLNIPVHLVNDVIFILDEEDLISGVTGEETKYIPSRDLSKIRFVEVLQAIRDHGDNPKEHITKTEGVFLGDTLDDVLADVRKKYNKITFYDLCKAHAEGYLKERKGKIENKEHKKV